MSILKRSFIPSSFGVNTFVIEYSFAFNENYYVIFIQRNKIESSDYTNYLTNKKERILQQIPLTIEEELAIKEQNEFGLRVIAGSLVFTALIIFSLIFFTEQAKYLTRAIAAIILLLAIIPFYVQRNKRQNKIK